MRYFLKESNGNNVLLTTEFSQLGYERLDDDTKSNVVILNEIPVKDDKQEGYLILENGVATWKYTHNNSLNILSLEISNLKEENATINYALMMGGLL